MSWPWAGVGQYSPAGQLTTGKPSQEHSPDPAGPPWQVPSCSQVLLKPQQYAPAQQPPSAEQDWPAQAAVGRQHSSPMPGPQPYVMGSPMVPLLQLPGTTATHCPPPCSQPLRLPELPLELPLEPPVEAPELVVPELPPELVVPLLVELVVPVLLLELIVLEPPLELPLELPIVVVALEVAELPELEPLDAPLEVAALELLEEPPSWPEGAELQHARAKSAPAATVNRPTRASRILKGGPSALRTA